MDNQQLRFHPTYKELYLAPDDNLYYTDNRNTYDVRPQCRKIGYEIDRYGYSVSWIPKAISKKYTPKALRVKTHRLLWEIYYQEELQDRIVHHVDNNPLNNHWINLKATTVSENNRESNKDFNARGRYPKPLRYQVIRAMLLNADDTCFGVKVNTLVEVRRKSRWVKEWDKVQRLCESSRAKWLETGTLDESMI